MDIAEKIHRAFHKGKSGRASANAGNVEFLSGYQTGMETDLDKEFESLDRFLGEWELRGEPLPGSREWARYEEWKRGFHASRLQRACLKVVKEGGG